MVGILETPIYRNERFTIDVIAEGKALVIKVNGLVNADHVDEMGESSVGHIALQQHNPKTVVEFRKIEIKELSGKGNSPSVAGDRAKPERARLLYSDNFSDKSEAWHEDPEIEAAKRAAHHVGIVDGVYRLDANLPGLYSWHSGQQLDDFNCEALCRVIGEWPGSQGSGLIEINQVGAVRGFQVRLTTQGEVFLERSSRTVKKHPKAPRFGPIRHSAIRIGGKVVFNLIGIRRVGRRAELFVNGESVLGPVDVEWEGTAVILLGVAAEIPNIRAEFDRFEVWEASNPGG